MMNFPRTSDGGSKQESMFSAANNHLWGSDGFIRPRAQTLDDVFLTASVDATQIADTFVLDGVSMEAASKAFSDSSFKFKGNESRRVFFIDDRGSICVIDYDPLREDPVQIRSVQDVYSELRKGDVSSFGVLQKILSDYPGLFERNQVEGTTRNVFVIAEEFKKKLQEFIREE